MVLIVLGVLLLMVAVAVGGYLWNNATARDQKRAAVEYAGFGERRIKLPVDPLEIILHAVEQFGEFDLQSRIHLSAAMRGCR